jgi:hypothetical protein
MTPEERRFYIHKHHAIDIKKVVKTKTPKVYQLIFKLNKQRIMFGNYGLCVNHLKNKILRSEQKNYSIIEYTDITKK